MIEVLKWLALLAVGALILADGFAHGAPRPTDRQLKRCFVYLPAMHDAKLLRWCVAQSRRLP